MSEDFRTNAPLVGESKAERKRRRKAELQAVPPKQELNDEDARNALPGPPDELLDPSKMNKLLEVLLQMLSSPGAPLNEIAEQLRIKVHPLNAAILLHEAKQLRCLGKLLLLVTEALGGPPSAPKAPHIQAYEDCHLALLAARMEGMEAGYPGISLAGFVWDLNDPLLPTTISGSPAAEEGRKQQPKGTLLLQNGVIPLQELAKLVEPIAHKLAGTTPSPIIMAGARRPAFIETLSNWRNAEEMPVVVIVEGQLSLLAMPVSALITPATNG